jgi:hypothetical protein
VARFWCNFPAVNPNIHARSLRLLNDIFRAFLSGLVMQWQQRPTGGTMLAGVMIVVLAAGVTFCLICIRGVLGEQKQHRHK